MDKRLAALEKQVAKLLKEHMARLSRLNEGMASLEKQLGGKLKKGPAALTKQLAAKLEKGPTSLEKQLGGKLKKGPAALTKQLAKIRKERMKAIKALSKRLL